MLNLKNSVQEFFPEFHCPKLGVHIIHKKLWYLFVFFTGMNRL